LISKYTLKIGKSAYICRQCIKMTGSCQTGQRESFNYGLLCFIHGSTDDKHEIFLTVVNVLIITLVTTL
jgi:hypothetical protein